MNPTNSRTTPHIKPIFPPLAVAAEVTRQKRHRGKVANFAPGIEGLSLLLSDDEVQWLARYLFDGAPCRTVASEWKVPRRTMAYRIRRAIRKLQQAGIPVVAPGRGRPRTKAAGKKRPYVTIDPAALDRLYPTGRHGSVATGIWIDGKEKTAAHEA